MLRISLMATFPVWLLALLLSGCAWFAPPPEPCDCGQAEKAMRSYMLQYFDTLEDNGNLRHQLKACEERK